VSPSTFRVTLQSTSPSFDRVQRISDAGTRRKKAPRTIAPANPINHRGGAEMKRTRFGVFSISVIMNQHSSRKNMPE
jgi:hypothetical protein